MDRRMKINIWYAILAVFGIIMLQNFWSQGQHVETIPYSEFERYLKDGRLSEVTVNSQSIQGTLKGGEDAQQQHVVANRVDPALADRLGQYGVPFSAATENTFLSNLLSWLLPMVLFFAVWMFLIRRMAEKQGFGGGMMAPQPTGGKAMGEVKNWNEEKGFGFIVPATGGGDVFAHVKDLVAATERPALARGQQVCYEVGAGNDGRPRAQSVTNADGSAISSEAGTGGGFGNLATARDMIDFFWHNGDYKKTSKRILQDRSVSALKTTSAQTGYQKGRLGSLRRNGASPAPWQVRAKPRRAPQPRPR